MRRALVPAVLLILGSAILGATVLREPIARGASTMSVLVSNTKSSPVPVTEQNLDGGNIRVHEEGTASVRIAGAALQPAQETEAFALAPGDTGGGGTVYTVPAGKRLVLETATVLAELPTGQRATANLLVSLAGATGKTGAGVGVFEIPMSSELDNGSAAISAGSLGSHAYADAGTTVDVSLGRSDGSGSASFTVAVAGYLVDMP